MHASHSKMRWQIGLQIDMPTSWSRKWDLEIQNELRKPQTDFRRCELASVEQSSGNRPRSWNNKRKWIVWSKINFRCLKLHFGEQTRFRRAQGRAARARAPLRMCSAILRIEIRHYGAWMSCICMYSRICAHGAYPGRCKKGAPPLEQTRTYCAYHLGSFACQLLLVRSVLWCWVLQTYLAESSGAHPNSSYVL